LRKKLGVVQRDRAKSQGEACGAYTSLPVKNEPGGMQGRGLQRERTLESIWGSAKPFNVGEMYDKVVLRNLNGRPTVTTCNNTTKRGSGGEGKL